MKSTDVSSAILFLCVTLSHGMNTIARGNFDEVTVVRENYGVTLQGILDNAHSVWHQTFVVPLGSSQLQHVEVHCNNFNPLSIENTSLTIFVQPFKLTMNDTTG